MMIKNGANHYGSPILSVSSVSSGNSIFFSFKSIVLSFFNSFSSDLLYIKAFNAFNLRKKRKAFFRKSIKKSF